MLIFDFLQYCGTNSLTQRYECAYGQPFYPYLYIEPTSKNRKPSDGPVCVKMTVDRTATMDECICPDSVNCERPLVVAPQSLLACYTCDLNSRSEMQPTECRDRKCLGNFCVLELHTEYSTKLGKTVRRVAGCLNTTSPDFVRTGCDQQWIEGSKEVIQCACAGHYCNSDLQTAALTGASDSLPNVSLLSLIIWLFLAWSFA